MSFRTWTLVPLLGICGVLGVFSLLPAGEPPAAGIPVRGLGSVRVIEDAFRQWREDKARSGGGSELVLGLGWSKAFSAEPTRARGLLTLDPRRGSVTAEVRGLGEQGGDLWLVDNRPGPGASDLPEPGDGLLRAGRLEPLGETARLSGRLDPALFQAFEVDLAVVTRPGQPPTRPALLYGHATLFQKLHFRSRRVAAPPDPVPAPLRGSGLLRLPKSASLAALIEQGEDLFFNETFGGNGRTCGTCHPAENDFTLDPSFIARLPADDPLFVFERNAGLAGLERPELLQRLALIVVNADGFEDPARKLVLRGVPHTLSLRTSVDPSPVFPGTNVGVEDSTVPPLQRTGWSGDGAPGSGTLLEFSLGAVMQHNPRTLARVPGVDFRVPSTEELEALEAFQLSLGRPSDYDDVFSIQPRDPDALEGLFIFLNGDASGGLAAGKCGECHADAGAGTRVFTPERGAFKFNGVFNAGHERMPLQPARLIDPGLPRDGGFGTTERCDLDGDGAPDPGVFGNCGFNAPPLIEAADTGPFFHHHAADTLEEAVAFYSTREFNESPRGREIGGISLTSAEEAKIVAFLRVVNALENLRQAQENRQKALASTVPEKARALMRLAAGADRDAAGVLEDSGLHPDAVARLRTAAILLDLAADGQVPIAVAAARADRIEAKARSLLVV